VKALSTETLAWSCCKFFVVVIGFTSLCVVVENEFQLGAGSFCVCVFGHQEECVVSLGQPKMLMTFEHALKFHEWVNLQIKGAGTFFYLTNSGWCLFWRQQKLQATVESGSLHGPRPKFTHDGSKQFSKFEM